MIEISDDVAWAQDLKKELKEGDTLEREYRSAIDMRFSTKFWDIIEMWEAYYSIDQDGWDKIYSLLCERDRCMDVWKP